MSDLNKIRTDVVGSLLRPAEWKAARVRLDTGAMDEASFRALEERLVERAVALQEGVGLDVVTDGEISRLNFQDSFGLSIGGYDAAKETLALQEQRAPEAGKTQRWDIPDLDGAGTPVTHRRPVKERLHLVRNVPLDEYRRVTKYSKKLVKVSLVGPDRIQQRVDIASSKAVYADLDAIMADVVANERRLISDLVSAGCRYVHIDEPGYTAYVDPPSIDGMKARGQDPDANLERSIRANAAMIANFPGVTFGIHLCRGNQASNWHREGTYDAIAERLFTGLPYDRFLLEYDTPRAGSFAPLRFVPKGKIVVLGLVSTKTPELESVDALMRRIDEAAKYVPLEQLAISPQCGFGSDVVGNRVSEDDQKRKLERVVEVARRVWGNA